ncbi:hypothetical protein PPERSA_02167 [Pseudocohnilembus persalinus]|uniref:F-BAR domain-containing protein n=1 Tax=Pseudocohnilembus persalinus TaxID=266149 RepID=A0A0V0Q7I8_PSEPJ|nr:hypothetical protein PPERSA_02167 [Pseudocohnilembus persalinus]|eukprot:KRW98189.1 hypothetical protein PPERSA_02167 [Pseudocohnilembus persalinus]
MTEIYSFKDNLWQYEEFIEVIQERANLEENYKNGLLKINQVLEDHMQNEGNFANIISALKSDQSNRAQACDQMIHSLRVEIVEMAGKIVEDQNNISRKIINEGKKWEKELLAIQSQLEKGKIMDEFQKQDKERIDLLKDCVYKCLIFETQQIKSMEYDINQIITLINKIDVEDGLQQFIKKNQSGTELYEQQNFEPYMTYASDAINKLKCQDDKFNYQIFYDFNNDDNQITPELQQSEQFYNCKLLVELLQNIFQNKSSKELEQEQLNISFKVKDISLSSKLLNLSFYFYTIYENEKTTLQNQLQDDITWQQKDFWESFTFDMINKVTKGIEQQIGCHN